MFDPAHHYWQADDGRIYSSASGGVVDADASDFEAWQEAGGVPSVWPRQDGEQTQAALNAVLMAYRPRVAPIITSKADLFRRATDAEAEMIDSALKAGSVRERLIFENAQYLDHADPLFETMRMALSGMFGADRADELLAPSAA